MTHSEVKKLPVISIRNILSSAKSGAHEKIQIRVKARGLGRMAEVKHLSGEEDMIVADAHGRETRIKITQITEIQSVRQIWREPRQKTSDEKAAEAGEVLIYAPLIPVGIISRPFLRDSGLDAEKNEEDEEKATRAYGGMSKEDLIKNIGEPEEKYYCEGEGGDKEVWVYGIDKVLRGGRAMFIGLRDVGFLRKGIVYHTSSDTTFFKKYDKCSALK